MIDPVNTVVNLVKTILVFLLIFYIVPSRFLPNDEAQKPALDKFFICLIHASLVVILVVHALAFLKIYETFSLFFALIAFLLMLEWRRGNAPLTVAESLGLGLVIQLMDMSEKKGLFKSIAIRLKKSSVSKMSGLRVKFIGFLTNPFEGILLFALLLLAAFIRFRHSLMHIYLGASDAYVHLAWVKYLGANNIYAPNLALLGDKATAGVYPYGYHAVLSALNKLFFIDPFTIARFIGPWGGFLIVLSICFFVKNNFKDRYVVWLSLLIYIASADLPSIVWRQISALPQEYATIFFLPGVHFLNDFLKGKKNSSLLLALECFALTILIHPYATVYLSIGYLVVSVVHIKEFIFDFKCFLKMFFFFPLAAALGLSPVALGLMLGIPWNGSFGYVQSKVATPDNDPATFSLSKLVEKDLVLQAFLICIAVVLVIIFIQFIIRTVRHEHENKMLDSKNMCIVLILALVIYMMYRPSNFYLPKLMDLARTGIFLSLLVPIIISSAGIFFIRLLIWNKYAVRILCSLICIFSIGYILNMNYIRLGNSGSSGGMLDKYFDIPKGYQLEYDDAAYMYMKIKSSFSALQWHIISPVEQYQQCVGYGFHYNLWQFVQELDNPSIKEIVMPSKDVFLFVEKIPLLQKDSVQESDAAKPFPEIKTNELTQYYTLPESRRVLEAKAFYWAEEYRKSHSSMTIFYDSDVFRVYRIQKVDTERLKLR